MRFLGFCNFYHKFIQDLSTVAQPLYCLLQKNRPFTWNSAAEISFQRLKAIIMNLPSLAYPDPRRPYDLHCDASNFGLGAALVQDGKPVAFASRTLNKAETNYTATEKECLAIVWALAYFHPYIFGAELVVYTDHAALKAIMSTSQPKGRIARWIMLLQAYHFTIIHKKGALNQDADALSRLSQNLQVQLDGPADYRKFQLVDPEIQLLLKKDIHLPFLMKNDLLARTLHDGSIVPVVPRLLVPMVLQTAHDQNTGGHFGIRKTHDKALQIGWWSSIKADVETWVKHCEGCQQFKIRTESTNAPMKPILPTRIGEIWAADIATLTTSKRGNKYLLVFMEYLSKWVVTAALPSLETDQIIQVLLFEIVLKLQLPERLLTDNGTNLISQAMAQVCSRLGIRRSLTSVEAPQTDGLVERLNRTIKTSLAITVGQAPDTWDEHLPFVTFAYNTATQESTGFSPFEVLFGVKARLPTHLHQDLNSARTYETEEWVAYLNNNLPLIQGTALENIRKSQVRQKRNYDKKKSIKFDYEVNDLVARKNLLKSGFPKTRWEGPFKILAPNNEDKTSWKLLKEGAPPHHATTANIRHMRPWLQQQDRELEVSLPRK